MNHARSAINQFTTTHHHAIKPCILSSSETIFIHVYKQNVKDKKNKKKKKKHLSFRAEIVYHQGKINQVLILNPAKFLEDPTKL